MEEIRECEWCKEPFTATRIDKLCCNKTCSTNFSAWRRKKGQPRVRKSVEDNGDLRKCNICGRWKNKKENFAKCGDFILGKCNDCRKEKEKAKKRVENKEELYNEVKVFVMNMKAKHYQCDGLDVWRLIDIYDRVLPSELNLPYLSGYNMDMEKSVQTMFYKVARWFADERDHLELKGTLR